MADVGSWVLSFFIWSAGEILDRPPQYYNTKTDCQRMESTESSRLNKQLPERFKVNTFCKPNPQGYSLKQLAGKTGWDCYKHAKCHGDKPDITVHVEVERQ